MERVIGTLVALSVMGGGVRASAEPKPQTSTQSAYRAFLEAADVNRDAVVSPVELERLVQRHVSAQVELRFRRLDRNRDGRVTRLEVPKMAAARFARFDVNGDGGFTLAEPAAVMRQQASRSCRRLLSKLDADGDGALSLADLANATDERLTQLELKPVIEAARR